MVPPLTLSHQRQPLASSVLCSPPENILRYLLVQLCMHLKMSKNGICVTHLALHLLLALIYFEEPSKTARMSICLPRFVHLVFPFLGYSVGTHQYGCVDGF